MTVSSSSQNQDDISKNYKSSYFGLPALDVSVAFPQATPASVFPPNASDYYQFDDLLNLEEQTLRRKVREVMEKDVAPIMTEAFCDLEPIYTYEGTYEINSLVTGREITGIASFKPAALTKRSRL
uniref:Uncharacterized protein n=1 Tax=Nelumbo nucifera TaxID=4432 RepID=A0A822Y1A2_NELNU|nr:TPA_asm: hypothetical protein HUJ06_027705 [Nelumbo nucifera]